MKIKPWREYFHKFSILDNGEFYMSIDDLSFKEIQSMIYSSIPWIYGFDYLQPLPEGQLFNSRPRIGHVFKRYEDKWFSLVFSPPVLRPNRMISTGSSLLGFGTCGQFISVAFGFEAMGRICTHNFCRDGNFLEIAGFSSKTQSLLWITFDKEKKHYFIRGIEGEKNICFRLDSSEFLFLRNLLKAAIPVLSGFAYTFES